MDNNKMAEMIVNTEERTCTLTKNYRVGGEVHSGSVFVAKYPSIIDRITIGSIRAKLLDGAPQESIDNMTDDFAYMIAFLQVTLTKAPKWFSLETIEEIDVLRDLFYSVVNWVNSFRGEIEGIKDEGNSSTTSNEAAVESD